MKFDLSEVSVVRATDGTFIVRVNGSATGQPEIFTAVDFDGLVALLKTVFGAPAPSVVVAGPATAQ